jgi:hypothetical protein
MCEVAQGKINFYEKFFLGLPIDKFFERGLMKFELQSAASEKFQFCGSGPRDVPARSVDYSAASRDVSRSAA